MSNYNHYEENGFARQDGGGMDSYGYDGFQEKSRKGLIIGICGALALAAVAGGGWWWYSTNMANDTSFIVKQSEVFELGNPVILDPSNFVEDGTETETLKKITLKSDLMTDSGRYTYNSQTKEVSTKGKKYLEKGTYQVTLELAGESTQTTFAVKDSKAPTFTGFAEKVSVEQDAQDVKLDSYWAAKDMDKVKITVSGKVDLKTPGEYKVKVTATDSSGNKTTRDATIQVVPSSRVRTGAALTKTKGGDIPLSSATNDMLKNGELNTSDKNDENIKKAQEKFDQEMKYAQQQALLKQEMNGWYNDGQTYMQGGIPTVGPATIDDQQYYFNGNGEKVTGWQKLNDRLYYYDDRGIMAIGTKEIMGFLYHFDINGAMTTGWRTDPTGTYYNDNNGVQRFGEIDVAGSEYYLDALTGARFSGFRVKGGNSYYYNDDGVKCCLLYTSDAADEL